ncbi:tyrosine--tRNA ligase [Phormidesmis priestleyi ULC007]|uniref:Tyrosine--tRNA ligase n=1 Tax=Phormidesmis priestleyi ULC007 TaxID=1920490 RepID=A0A2T1DEG7_9CYAN|nr:tyrosine--tRNA ligase [Phormidesmis priestleyi]PSB18856.1 tyrosine--tRNA ligase [Phormidesmis priestleyi ULC007]PZO51006.1 MAG: tyrosine--tRNA ligase [Phormidesmis priestleyi]
MSNSFPWLHWGNPEIFPNQPESKNPNENLEQRLTQSNRPLRIKLGIDPTGTDIHLGHSILFRKLRSFQDAGHTAVVIIGDFTARIGDPTGKSEVRRQLTEEQVAANAETYLKQVRPILDFDTPGRLEVRYNSEWLSKLDLPKTLALLATMTVGQMLAKEGFAERYKQGTAIYLHEFLYPLMQGYDSVAVQADVELGGTDQKFNLAVGRDLQKHFGQTPQFGLLMPILIGTDGVQKMSKSLGNYVGLSEDALSMYSKLEKTPDTLILQYFELLTDLSLDQLPEGARDRQKLLALEIASQYHGREKALEAQKAASELVQGGTSKTDVVPEFSLGSAQFPAKVFYLVSASGLCKTSSDARRQIQGGAVRLDGNKIEQVDLIFESPDDLIGKVLQLGKNKFVRFVP